MRLRAHEQRDADEPDAHARQAEPGDAHLPEEAEGDHGVEDRDGRLDDRGEARRDPRLPPGEKPERDRDVHEADNGEPAGVGLDLGDGLAAADEEGDDHHERERSEAEPAEDQRGRGELPDGDLDEEEARAPEERDGGQHQGVAASHSLIQRLRSAVCFRGYTGSPESGRRTAAPSRSRADRLGS